MGGYGLQWDGFKENSFISDTSKSAEKYIPGVLIAIAYLVGISFGYKVLKWASKTINRDSGSEYYNLFWSFQFLAALINVVHTIYMYDIATSHSFSHTSNCICCIFYDHSILVLPYRRKRSIYKVTMLLFF